MKIDLHVHSRYSTRPSQWVLRKLGCQECYTEPLTLYRLARERGMSQVTITDHNVIDGCLEIASQPCTFISEEVTTYFPEDGCKIHVLVYRLDEAQHREIQKARENIYDLVEYLRGQQLFHTVAHPFWAVNDRLTPAHFEKLLLLFENFELNGGRDERLNEWLKLLITLLTSQEMAELAERHGLTPPFPQPWVKRFTGGSDDHSSLTIARMYTEVEEVESLEEFFQGLREGRGRVGGQASTPLTLGHSIYSIAYQFYRNKFGVKDYVSHDVLLNFLEKNLFNHQEKNANGVSKFFYLFQKIKDVMGNSQEQKNLFTMLKKETSKLTCPEDNSEIQWYSMVQQVSQSILKNMHRHFRKAVTNAHFIDLVNTLSSQGLIYLGLAPYIATFSSFAADRKLGSNIRDTLLGKKLQPGPPEKTFNLAHFTDTFYEINGVSVTLHHQVEEARKAGWDYTLITCDQQARSRTGVRNFVPVGVFQLPEYPAQKVFHPPFLEILKFCYEQCFTHIQAATPGSMGLTALAVAKILKLPLWGTYHTALPQYALYLTEDQTIFALMWKYLTWFYNQMEVIFAPSQSTAAELAEAGISPEKLRVFPRGVDLERFHPGRRNGFLESRYGLPAGLKLLYVGRVSKEKNLELLSRVFRSISGNGLPLHLVVVGEGPYLQEMQEKLTGAPVTFTGFLEGEDLAAVYASCDLFVFPSTTDTFGNVVLEAQASGLPVIVSDAGGPQENLLPGETGLVVAGDNEEELAAAILELAAQPERLRDMGRAARSYAESRSFAQAFRATWKMYQDLSRPF